MLYLICLNPVPIAVHVFVRCACLARIILRLMLSIGILFETVQTQIQRSAFYQLRQLRSVRRSLSVNACTALVHAFVTSRLDYCNSLLAGIGDGLIDQLQTVLRVAARLVLRKRKFDPISADIRDRLHWLPIRSRIDFKLGLLVYKCLQGTAPGYLTEMLVQKSTVPALSRLRSTARGDLLVPRTNTRTILSCSIASSMGPPSGTIYLTI